MGHYCYVLRSLVNGRLYIGYTVDVARRLRRHNGELQGGAKKTRKHRPWEIVMVIGSFDDNHEALSFEWHFQRLTKNVKKMEVLLDRMHTLMSSREWSYKDVVFY